MKNPRKAARIRPTVGSVRERNGAWYLERYINFKQRMYRLGSTGELPNKQAAVDAANKLIATQDAETALAEKPATGADMLIADYAEKTFLPWAERNKALSTYRGYRRTWFHPLKAHFGAHTFATYRTSTAAAFLNSLALAGRAQNTINHARAEMSLIFAHAVSDDILPVNPIHGAKQREAAKRTPKTQHYTVAEMRQILTGLNCDATAQAQAIMALAFLGVRRGEISGLRWSDVDLVNRVLHIRVAAWQGVAKELPKNEQSVRDIALGPNVIASLTRWRRLAARDALYVFQNESGGPLDLGVYSVRVLMKLFKSANLTWRGYHAGRRGAVTAQRDTGDARAVAANMGHSEEVLRELYDKGNAEAAKAAALAFDALLNNGQTDTVQ
jgi:integrase